MPPDTAYTIKLNNREKIESYTPYTPQPPKLIPHSTLIFLLLLSPLKNNIHIHHCLNYLSIPIPPYPQFPLKNGVYFFIVFLKPIPGFYFCHLWMYFATNTHHHITSPGGSLLLTASWMISQILKCTGIPPSRLLMGLHGPQICSLLLFWKPLIPSTSLSASIGPYLKQKWVGYDHNILIDVTENSRLGVALHLIPRFAGN